METMKLVTDNWNYAFSEEELVNYSSCPSFIKEDCYVFTLVEGRYQTPSKNFIFKAEDIGLGHPKHFAEMQAKAIEVLEEVPVEVEEVFIIVTGYAPALIAALNAAKYLALRVVLFHHDRNTNMYISQIME